MVSNILPVFIKIVFKIFQYLELLALGKEQKALVTLYEIIRKRNQTWQKAHEEIIRKYLELCIKFKNSQLAKDGLHQYKGLCQQVNAKSFQDILRGFLQAAEEKTEAARDESQQALVDVDDLEAVNTAESLLLKAVSGEGAQDRQDRSTLLPWVKFLWESYRQCLELLRNNKNVEELYSHIAQQALRFCMKYERRAEFKKLCELFRNHLSWTIRMQQHSFSVVLREPASFERHVEVRFNVLDVAIKMELWQEAYKAIEDIHQVCQAAERPLLPARQAAYFERAAHIFWKSGNLQYHALACQRLYQLTKENKKTLTEDELQLLASRVVCSTLSVPMLPPANLLLDAVTEADQRELLLDEKGRHVARLLFIPGGQMSSRIQMVADLQRKQILQFAYPALQPLFNCLENEFDPYGIVPKMEKCLDLLQSTGAEKLLQYVEPLHEAAAVRCIQQLAQVYDNLSLESVVSMLSFVNKFRLEEIICSVAKLHNMHVSIDHQRSLVVFRPSNAALISEAVDCGQQGQGQATTGGDLLLAVANVISDSGRHLSGSRADAEWSDKIKYFVALYKQNTADENARNHLVEQRIAMNEERLRMGERLREEVRQREEDDERRAREEQIRQRQLEEERKQQMELEAQKDQLERARVKEILEATGERGSVDSRYDNMTSEQVIQHQIEKAKQMLKERTKKMKQYEKKLDHLVRARRIEEIPLLEQAYEEFKERDPREWEEAQAKLIAKKEAEAQYAIETKKRLSRMESDCTTFLAQMKEQRAPEYQRALVAWQKLMEEKRSERLAERAQQRKQQRRREWQAKQAEQAAQLEEQRAQEEEQQQIKIQQSQRSSGPSGYVPPHMRRAMEREQEQQQQQQPMRGPGQVNASELSSWRNQSPAASPAPPQSGGAYMPPGARRGPGDRGNFGSDSRGFGGAERGFGSSDRGFGGSDSRGQGGFGGSDSRGQGGFGGSDSRGQGGFGGSDSRGQGGFGGPEGRGQGGFGGSDNRGQGGFGGSDSRGQGGFGGSDMGDWRSGRGRPMMGGPGGTSSPSQPPRGGRPAPSSQADQASTWRRN